MPFVDEHGAGRPRRRRALRDRASAGSRGRTAEEAIDELNAGQRPGRLGRPALRRRRLDRAGRGRRSRGGGDGDIPRAEGRARGRARPLPRGRGGGGRHRPRCRARRGSGGRRAAILELVPRRTERDNKYTAGLRARRRRLARPDGRAVAHRRGGAPRRRRHRHRLRARVPQPRLRAAPRRGDDAAVSGRGGRARRRTPPTRSSRRPSGQAPSRSGRASAGPTARAALVGFLLDRLDKPVVLDADGLWALAGHLDWVFSRDAPTVLTPHAGELGRLLGRRSDWVARQPARRGAGGRRRRRRGRPAQGRGHARRRARAATRWSSTWGTRASPPPGAATCSPASSRPSSPRAWRGALAAAAAAAACGVASRLAAERHGQAGMIARDVVESLSPGARRGEALAASRSTWARSGATPSACATAAGPAELWAVVKADAYGHGAVDAARAALEPAAPPHSAWRPCARELELREAFPSARILVMGPLARGEEAGARDARLEAALDDPGGARRAALSTSRWTPAWAAGG